jgi:endogenous inhibitor of DNA gyrase (YacG/DUF329 family)
MEPNDSATNNPLDWRSTGHSPSVVVASTAVNTTDQREALFNNRPVGLAAHIQVPRESVTRLWGLVVDLDANILKPNPWFPPADTAEAFYTAIAPVLERHPVLRHAEIRDTGRWLHAIVRFNEPVELKSAKDQKYWTDIHKVLMGSVPSDSAAPALIALTRPISSVNGKTQRPVRMLKAAIEVSPGVLVEWTEEVKRSPFQMIGQVLFGEQRVKPCPYCQTEGSHFDLGERVGFCYGPCKQVPLNRLFEPFLTAPSVSNCSNNSNGGEQTVSDDRKTDTETTNATPSLPTITIAQDAILEIDPRRVREIVLRFKKRGNRKKR